MFTQRKKLLLACGMTSLIILLFYICFAANAAEDIVMGLIHSGQLDKKYLSAEGWYIDYSTLTYHHFSTGIFIVTFYLTRFFKENSKNIAAFLALIYLIAEVVIISQFIHYGFLIGLAVLLILLLARATFMKLETEER